MSRGEPRPLHPVEALLAVGLSFVLLPTAGSFLQLRYGFVGIALSELFVVALPVVAVTALSRVRATSAFGWEAPTGRAIGGALLTGAAAFYLVAGGLEVLQERVAPIPPAVREQLRELIVPAAGPRPLPADLLVLAILPALCEEALFRGALLRALAPREVIGPAGALLVTSVAFGAFHYSLFKFLPTATLGLMLGVVALRARSTWASVVAHVLNNTLVVLLLRAGWEDPPGAGSTVGVAILVVAVPVLFAGIKLIRPR